MPSKRELIAENMRLCRVKSGLSQHEVAQVLGVSDKTVFNWELSGGISFNDAWKLADLFKIPLCQLAGRTEVNEAIPD